MLKPLRFEIGALSSEKLIKYAEFLLRHYRLVDAYWFLRVEDTFGLDVATYLNEEIWAKLGEVSAKDIMKYMDISEGNLENVLNALKYFPWTMIADWKIAELTDRTAVILAEKCPPQQARINSGRKSFSCMDMEQKCLENFAKVFNPRIKVRCCQGPLDNKPQEYWCKWEFILE